VAVQVALVGEAGQASDVGGQLAAFQEPAGEIDPQRHLIGVRWPGAGRSRRVRKDVQALVPLPSVGSLPMITTYCTAGA
jgi:hypothetical protein